MLAEQGTGRVSRSVVRRLRDAVEDCARRRKETDGEPGWRN